MPAIKPPKDCTQVLHAAQLVLAYYFERVHGRVKGKAVDGAMLVTTGSYFRQLIPLSEFSIMLILALNNLRNATVSCYSRDEEERLIALKLYDYLKTDIGKQEFEAASLLAAYIDRHDIDMRLIQHAHDESGMVMFDFDKMTGLGMTFIAIRALVGIADYDLQREAIEFLPDVNLESCMPKIFSVSDESARQLAKLIDRDPAVTEALKRQYLSEAKKIAAQNP